MRFISKMMKTAAAAALLLIITGCSGDVKLNTEEIGKMVLTAERSGESSNGAGFEVPEGCTTIKVEYNITKGSCDLKITGADLSNPDAEPEELLEEVNNGELVSELTGLSGEASITVDAAPGSYIMTFTEHNMTGTVTLTAE